jgi:ABC-type sugar transport system ATPase subunit
MPIELGSPADALARGIATVHQELALLPNLTVTQNMFLAQEQTRLGLLQRKQMRVEAQEMVEKFGLEIDASRAVGDYPVATRQLLELAIATHRNMRFLLLDEPTTSLEGDQIEELLDTIRNLARNSGVGIMLVDHKLDELYAVADHVVALVDGHVRINGPAADVPRAAVVRAVVGDDASVDDVATADLLESTPSAMSPPPSDASATAPRAKTPGAANTVALAVRGLRTKEVTEITFTARTGQILGIYGLVGSGRTELLRTLIGLDKVQAGAIELFGRPYKPRNPAAARDAGIVYLTEERKRDGIIPPLDAIVNVSLPVLNRFRKFGFLQKRPMRRSTNAHLDALRVRGDRNAPVTRLSGGNQQKILFARALAQQPKVLLLDEPTKGVDIGVKSDIHRMIRDLAHKQGLAIILVSSEEEELLDVADEIVVFVGGQCDGQAKMASTLNATQLRREAWVSA